jgi:rRNA-processing protein FCF1
MTQRAKGTVTPKVILDSNALFVPLEFRIDIDEKLRELLKTPFELILLSPIVKEIRKIAHNGSPSERKKAAFALNLAKKYKVVKVENESETSTDDLILKTANEWKSPVFTNDKLLRKRLRDINVPVIYVRQKSLLTMEGRMLIPV